MLNLWSKIFETSAARVYAALAMLAVTVVTARILGPDGRGVLVAVISWMTLFASVASLSLGEVSQYWIQLNRKRNWLPPLLGSMLLCLAGLSLLAAAVAIALYWWSDGALMRNIPASFFAIGMLLIPFIIWEQYARYLLLGVGKITLYNIAQVLGGTVGIVAVVGFLAILKQGVSGALFAHMSGVAVFAVIALVSLLRVTSFRIEIDMAGIRRLLGDAMKLHLNTIGVLLMAHANILMLNHYSSTEEVGWYQFSMQLVMAMLIVPQAGAMILYSRVAENGPDRTWPEQKRLIGQIFAVMMVFSVAAYLLAPELVVLLGGAEFEPSVVVFRQLIPVLFGMSFALLMGPQWIGRGVFLLTSIVTVVTGIVNVCLNLFLIPAHGMMGAVWSMNLSFFLIVVIVQSVFAGWVERKSRAARPRRTMANGKNDGAARLTGR
ncbi:MAG: oligosaccharide flippase family protein [Phycisphaerales bacterium]|nr:MAG: oligosaccharide flippase family protein [Phycisphaerales bacterium]